MVGYPCAVPRIRCRITGETTSSRRCPTVTLPSSWHEWMPRYSRSWSPINASVPSGPERIVPGVTRPPPWWRPWINSMPYLYASSRRSWRTRRSSRRIAPGSSKRGLISRRSYGSSRTLVAWRRLSPASRAIRYTGWKSAGSACLGKSMSSFGNSRGYSPKKITPGRRGNCSSRRAPPSSPTLPEGAIDICRSSFRNKILTRA